KAETQRQCASIGWFGSKSPRPKPHPTQASETLSCRLGVSGGGAEVNRQLGAPTAVAVHQAHQPDVEKPDLEQDDERNRGVDAGVHGKPKGSGEIEAEEQLDGRKQVFAPPIAGADARSHLLPLDTSLGSPGEAGWLVEERLGHCLGVVD